MINGINHIALSVSDLNKSFAFYKDVLGFQPLAKWEQGAYFKAGELWFCLFGSEKVQIDKSYTHFAFDVDQNAFETISENILKNGVSIWQENISEGDSLYFLDPDGYRLEIHTGDWQSRIAAKKLNPWPNAEFYI